MSLAEAVPSAFQRRLAVVVVCILLAYSAAAVPLAEIQGPTWPNLLGVYQTAVVIGDLMTAILLFFQFQQFRGRALLVLSSGYLFTAVIAIVHMLSFPGLFGPNGVIGGSSQTTNYLWVVWHLAFPLFLLGYLALDRRGSAVRDRRQAHRAIGVAVLLVLGGVFGLTVLVLKGDDYLPPLIVGRSFHPLLETGVGQTMAVVSLAAVALALRQYKRSIVKLWLTVTIVAFTLDVLLVLHGGTRFSIGWYAARANSLVASMVVLAVYVIDITYLLRHWVTASQELAEANASLARALDEQKRLAAEAESANRAKSRFLAAASHDIRQPVQSLMLFMSLLQTKLEGRAEAALVASMDTALRALKMLLDGILDISKLDAGVVVPTLRPFAIADILDGLAAEYAPRAAAKGLRFRMVRCAAWANSDQVLLTRIMRNLLENAYRYTDHGSILVGVRRRGRYLRVEVHDTGVGIPEGRLTEIFEEFVQIGNEERDRDKGLGLGLAIVKRLSRLLRHPVTARSRVGRGSVFTIELPVAEAPEARLQRARPPVMVPTPATVVVIDDEAIVCQALAAMLEDLGYRVITATSGDEAVAAVSGAKPALVIADYRLRERKTGTEAIGAVRQAVGFPVPAIVITGDTAPARIREVKASGFELLHKPVSAEMLSALVARMTQGTTAKAS